MNGMSLWVQILINGLHGIGYHNSWVISDMNLLKSHSKNNNNGFAVRMLNEWRWHWRQHIWLGLGRSTSVFWCWSWSLRIKNFMPFTKLQQQRQTFIIFLFLLISFAVWNVSIQSILAEHIYVPGTHKHIGLDFRFSLLFLFLHFFDKNIQFYCTDLLNSKTQFQTCVCAVCVCLHLCVSIVSKIECLVRIFFDRLNIWETISCCFLNGSFDFYIYFLNFFHPLRCCYVCCDTSHWNPISKWEKCMQSTWKLILFFSVHYLNEGWGWVRTSHDYFIALFIYLFSFSLWMTSVIAALCHISFLLSLFFLSLILIFCAWVWAEAEMFLFSLQPTHQIKTKSLSQRMISVGS